MSRARAHIGISVWLRRNTLIVPDGERIDIGDEDAEVTLFFMDRGSVDLLMESCKAVAATMDKKEGE